MARLLVLSCLVASGALAATKSPRLVVEVVGLDAAAKTSAPTLRQLAEVAARGAGRFEVFKGSEVVELATAQARADHAAKGAELVALGQKDLDDLDPVKALKDFTEALAEYRQADLSREDVFQQYVKTWVLKAGAHVTNGEAQLAKQEIEKIVGISVRAEFPDAYFPPDFLKVVEQQRRQVAKAQAALGLASTPPGARVWVDGQYRGVTPLTVKPLAGARHVVVVDAPGFRRVQDELWPGEESLALEAAKNAEALKVLERSVAGAPTGSPRDEALRTFAQLAKADQALLVVAKKSLTGEKLELTGLRVETKDGHNLAYRTTVLPIADEPAIAAFLEGLVSRDAPRDGTSPVTHHDGSGGLSNRKIAGIGLLAGSAALIGAGIACGVSANARAAEYRSNPQVRTQISDNLAGSGRTFSVLADVSFVAAAISAGVGTYLLVSSPSTAIEPDATPEPKKPEPKAKDAPKAEPLKPEPAKADPKADAKQKAADEAKRKAEELRAAEKQFEEEEAALRKQQEEAAAAKKKAEDDAAAAKKAEEDAAAAKKKADEEAAAAKKKGGAAALKKKADDEAAAKKKADDEAAAAAKKAADDEAKKKKDAEKAEEDRLRKLEEERKRQAAEKKKKEEEDDLRNY